MRFPSNVIGVRLFRFFVFCVGGLTRHAEAAARREYGRLVRRRAEREGTARAGRKSVAEGLERRLPPRREALPRVCLPCARFCGNALRLSARAGRGRDSVFGKPFCVGRLLCFEAFVNKKAAGLKKIGKNTEINIDKTVRKC